MGPRVRILIVSPSYFPALTARAFRWTAIAEWLVAHGHHVDVVCAKVPGLVGLEVVNGVMIHRAGGIARESLKRWLARKSAPTMTSPGAISAASRPVRGRVGDVLRTVYDYTFQKVLWPDSTGFWYFPALRTARKLIEAKRHDIVVSVSLPFTGHLVGLALKRLHRVRWVVDIGDPFSFMSETPVNNHRLFGRLNYRVESKVLKNADFVSVTTKETKTEYLKYFPNMPASKMTVIPPFFVEPTELDPLTQFFTGPPKMRLVFAGTLYSRIRNPAALLELFSSLLATSVGARLELHFLGVINDCEPYFAKYRKLIGTKVFLHGLVSRVSAVRAMKDANILVNIGNSTSYQLPSKVVEYMMLGKPVLNITKLATDSSRNFFLECDGVCTVTEEALSADGTEFARVKEFIENPPPFSQANVDGLTRVHGLETIADSYLALFRG